MSLKWGQKLEDALFILYNVSWEVFAAIYQKLPIQSFNCNNLDSKLEGHEFSLSLSLSLLS